MNWAKYHSMHDTSYIFEPYQTDDLFVKAKDIMMQCPKLYK